jgi:ABC-type transport system involved in cytochrome c biogenesis permease subunit
MRRVTANFLRLASVPLGIVVGLWTASLSILNCYGGHQLSSCPSPRLLPVFAAWECVLVGLGAVVVLVLASEAVARLRSPS